MSDAKRIAEIRSYFEDDSEPSKEDCKFLLDYIDRQQAVVDAAKKAALINTNIDISALRKALAAMELSQCPK